MRRIGLIAAAGVFLTLAARAPGQGVADELEPNLGWLNTDRPLRFSHELKGHIVLIDFWTYCCINCHNVIEELEFLEHKYADEPFIVIGVHSAKFETESQRANVREAMFRYGVKHPVVVDDQMGIWNAYGTTSWPTLLLVGADGRIIGAAPGEGNRDILDREIAKALAKGREDGTLATERFEVKLDAAVPSTGGLSFPGKVHASAQGGEGRLFIADSTNDRVVVTTWPDATGRCTALKVFGGERGFADGNAATVQFDDPQGMDYDAVANILYVSDTRNHAVRAIDLTTGNVTTLAGTGEQSRDRQGGALGTDQGLNAPWDVALSPDKKTLYIAMAGPHQLWKVDLDTRRTQAIAGGKGENLADGRAERALLAQPSSLALSGDGTRLYFADSEVSAIRFMNLRASTIGTLVGTGLFDFGDVDGAAARARLQHPLGVTLLPGDTPRDDRLLIADTYNSKIKQLNPRTRFVEHWLGRSSDETQNPGDSTGADLVLNEPGGLHLAQSPEGEPALFVADTNNHRIVMVDPSDKSWREIMIVGLEPESNNPAEAVPTLEVSAAIALDGPVSFEFKPDLPGGAKLNAESPMFVIVRDSASGEPIVQTTIDVETAPTRVTLAPEQLKGSSSIRIDLSFGYCFANESVCVPGEIAWKIDLAPGEQRLVTLSGPVR